MTNERPSLSFPVAAPITSLAHYRLLGRSGLRVSPLALGTMTFGDDWGWGSDAAESRRVFDAYVDRGGNFIDTASNYTNGTSESLIGAFAEGRRDNLVIATKYTLNRRPGDPNAGGNHRKNMVQSVETSLRRLRSDHIDLLYLHVWDGTTPVEEILRALDDLVRAGKVLYAGISDTPAWQVSRMQAIADLRGWTPFVALQIEHSLIERTVERDLIPMAQELGLGVVPWGPLAGGVLAGKYSEADLKVEAGVPIDRKSIAAVGGALTPRGLAIAEVVKTVARELGHSPSRVALAWLASRPGVTAPIIGARTLAQLEDNLAALELELSADQHRRLDEVSAIDPGFPHKFLALPGLRSVLFGGATIEPRR